MTLEEIELTREETRPRRLEVADDGSVWYVDYAGGKLGRYHPDDGSISEWDMPSGDSSRPYGTAMDDQGRLWTVETGVSPNRFVGFDTKTNEFIPAIAIASDGGTVRHMYFDAERNAVWFGTDTNTIGRAQLE